MSCRIDRVVIAGHRIVLYISGQITGQDVDMLRNIPQQEAGALAIDLKNVYLVDREGVQLLTLSEDNGAELKNCLAYIREWVARERGRRVRRTRLNTGSKERRTLRMSERMSDANRVGFRHHWRSTGLRWSEEKNNGSF